MSSIAGCGANYSVSRRAFSVRFGFTPSTGYLAGRGFPLVQPAAVQRFKLSLVYFGPRREGISELFQLDDLEQQQMWRETTALAQTLKEVFEADKMNVATLGNVVSQLHMHVIVRYQADAAWPGPVWGKHPAKPYTQDEANAVRGKLKAVLGNDFTLAEVKA